ncbi:glucuronate isomerase [Pedobacter yulinensis]|uniref:Uronate isomerase n=1 Tax=Pedobacter yulinensis TaxID=2126353 RepID=A0A2T3HLX5_9SPHI|nr:glucuronate isomerase [Pedobacter yulinensis]PST83440.1 glucuronate isomerase [Pedobacter yulinensis]
MNAFINDRFLLQSELAVKLYNDYAKDLPVIDYHSHLPPDVIAVNAPFGNISKVWLAGDHYKWRAMRTLGVAERNITGTATDREKFRSWAACVPYTLRSPLYHWTHMELKNPFGISELLDEKNADRIYDQTSEILQTTAFLPQSLLGHYRVEMLGTTDDPADTLEFHGRIAAAGFKTRVLPSFRPDKCFGLGQGQAFREYIERLAAAAGGTISSLDQLKQALEKRIDFFHAAGCRISDHGLSQIPVAEHDDEQLDRVLRAVLNGNDAEGAQFADAFTFHLLLFLGQCYAKRGWVQQFHLGAIRNNNSAKMAAIGADAGYDSIGDYPQATGLSRLFNRLEAENGLAKTVIYNLNPADNAVFATMIGNFQGEGIRGKIQFGSGWWFLDQLDGMEQQMNSLSNMGLISCFIGMLTDSRSFLSYSRHDYFRRLLCQLFAEDMRKGLIPNDPDWTGKIIQDICYYNAKAYFNF